MLNPQWLLCLVSSIIFFYHPKSFMNFILGLYFLSFISRILDDLMDTYTFSRPWWQSWQCEIRRWRWRKLWWVWCLDGSVVCCRSGNMSFRCIFTSCIHTPGAHSWLLSWPRWWGGQTTQWHKITNILNPTKNMLGNFLSTQSQDMHWQGFKSF